MGKIWPEYEWEPVEREAVNFNWHFVWLWAFRAHSTSVLCRVTSLHFKHHIVSLTWLSLARKRFEGNEAIDSNFAWDKTDLCFSQAASFPKKTKLFPVTLIHNEQLDFIHYQHLIDMSEDDQKDGRQSNCSLNDYEITSITMSSRVETIDKSTISNVFNRYLANIVINLQVT